MRITIDLHFKYISYQLRRTGRPGQTPGYLVAKQVRPKIENTTNIKTHTIVFIESTHFNLLLN